VSFLAGDAVLGGAAWLPPPAASAAGRGAAKAPKYAALRDRLAEQILCGDIPRGEKLPSETALGRRFRVSRVTVRHALESLREAGLVESRQGQGHFARQVKISLEIGRLNGFGEILRQQGIASTTEMLSLEEVDARPQVRKELQLPALERVVRLVRLRRVGATPVCLETRLIRPEVGRRLFAMDVGRVEMCRLYETELGIELGYAHVSLDYVGAPAAAACAMEIEKGAALMRLRHLVFEGARPIEVCERLCLPSAFEITARAGRW
jgi:GntR family transcriptional regulator